MAFVDKPIIGSTYGFDFDRAQIAKLQASSPSTLLLGHLQSNPQNGSTTESYTYIQQWTLEQRIGYVRYWASEQRGLKYRFMYPVFYPLCPGAYAYDPLKDLSSQGFTFYDLLGHLMDTSTR